MEQSDIRAVPSDVRADILNALVGATINVVQTMTGTAVERRDLRIVANPRERGDVTGIIGLTSESIDGTLAVSFSEPCILALVSELLGEPFDAMSDEISDAVGEFTNIISGQARADLSRRGYQFDMAVPMVVARKDHRISVLTGQTVVIVTFDTQHGPFFIQVCLNPRDGQS